MTARADASLPLTLTISFSLRNHAALKKLLSDVQNPASPRYHRWLTPAQFDARFGRTPAEVEAVKQWVLSQGFTVTRATAREIVFTGIAAQAEDAFATTLTASSDGSLYANAADPQVPARFAGLVGSITGLDNTRAWHPLMTRGPSAPAASGGMCRNRAGDRAPIIGSAKVGSRSAIIQSNPDFEENNQGLGFGPGDLYAFYDESPLLNLGINGGGGDCLAIIEDSDYLDAAANLFDTTFSLPTPSAPPNFTVTRVFADGTSPGSNTDEDEALSDVEWAHGVAPGASINMYIGNAATATIDPLTDSITRAVNDNLCGTITISYSFCGGPSSFYSGTLDSLFEQAAAQGQSFFLQPVTGVLRVWSPAAAPALPRPPAM